jgi:hypothetical protein
VGLISPLLTVRGGVGMGVDGVIGEGEGALGQGGGGVEVVRKVVVLTNDNGMCILVGGCLV